jgi:heptosyltransferase-1
MGDVIHTLYAVSALRADFPEMRLGWAIEERWSELIFSRASDRCGPLGPLRPLVDCVHQLNTRDWRRSLLSSGTWRDISSGFGEIRAQHYEAAVDFQGAIKSGLIARFAGAQVVVGPEHPREMPARIAYKARIKTEGAHVIEQYRSLAEAIGGESLPFMLPQFPCDPLAEASVAALASDTSRNLVILNPGAGWAAKQWPTERYGEVAKELKRNGMRCVVNYSGAEQGLALKVQAASGGTAEPIGCTVGELIALTRRARLFIGGDTGPLHLAAAMGVPVVAIFGPTDPARNGPYQTKSVVLRNAASRTSLSHTSTPDPGLQQITVAEVTSAALQLLENFDG